MAINPPYAIDVYGARTGNCLRVSITLEEMALPYRSIRVNLRDGEQTSLAHLALNPAGKVPVIVDRGPCDGPFVLTQSNAIMLHLAEKTPGRLLPVHDPAERGRAYERFFYFLTDVIAPSHAAFALKREGQMGGAEILEERALTMLGAGERFLEEELFMAGARFSLADIAAFTIVMAYDEAIDWPKLPRLQRWFADMQRRPALERGLHAFDPRGV